MSSHQDGPVWAVRVVPARVSRSDQEAVDDGLLGGPVGGEPGDRVIGPDLVFPAADLVLNLDLRMVPRPRFRRDPVRDNNNKGLCRYASLLSSTTQEFGRYRLFALQSSSGVPP